MFLEFMLYMYSSFTCLKIALDSKRTVALSNETWLLALIENKVDGFYHAYSALCCSTY